MNRKAVGRTGITIFICIFLLAGAYAGLAEYYKNRLSYGTWINGIYCTGNIQPDHAKIEEFADALAEEYDTVGNPRAFKTTRGEIIAVEGGIYGNQMDRKEEKEYLKAAFAGKTDEIHIPQYTQTGWRQGKDDIGDTYIEVDMTEQMMYYYMDGSLELETPIVTGNTGRRRGTPVVMFY